MNTIQSKIQRGFRRNYPGCTLTVAHITNKQAMLCYRDSEGHCHADLLSQEDEASMMLGLAKPSKIFKVFYFTTLFAVKSPQMYIYISGLNA